MKLKHLPAPLAVAGALLLPLSAQAATPKTGKFVAPKGAVQLGYDLSFKVDRGGRRISKLFARVLENCSGSSMSTVTSVGPNLTWKVRKGRFSGRKKETFDGITVYTTLKGRFTSPTTAKGTIRQESIVAGSTCDTYKLKFTAKRR